MTSAELLTLASLLSLAASGVAALVGLHVRAKLAELRVMLLERSEARREACRQEFATRTDLEALASRVGRIEQRKAAAQ